MSIPFSTQYLIFFLNPQSSVPPTMSSCPESLDPSQVPKSFRTSSFGLSTQVRRTNFVKGQDKCLNSSNNPKKVSTLFRIGKTKSVELSGIKFTSHTSESFYLDGRQSAEVESVYIMVVLSSFVSRTEGLPKPNLFFFFLQIRTFGFLRLSYRTFCFI